MQTFSKKAKVIETGGQWVPIAAQQINVSFEVKSVTGYQSVDCFLLQLLVVIQLAVPLERSRQKRQETGRHCFMLL